MKGKIIKIDQLKASRNRGQTFYRVYFKLKRAQGEFFWAKTDIVPSFRNFKHWKPFLEVGTILDGLRLKADQTVDADSKPILLRRPFKGESINEAIDTGEKQHLQQNLFSI